MRIKATVFRDNFLTRLVIYAGIGTPADFVVTNMEIQTIMACMRSTLTIGTLICPKSLSEQDKLT